MKHEKNITVSIDPEFLESAIHQHLSEKLADALTAHAEKVMEQVTHDHLAAYDKAFWIQVQNLNARIRELEVERDEAQSALRKIVNNEMAKERT